MADMAKVKDIDENLMRSQPSLPYRAAQGLKNFATNIAAPAATSVYDVASLPTRAIKFGVGEAISGALGDRPSEQFQTAPVTSALSRAVAPTPVEQGLKFPTMPQIGQGGGLAQQPATQIGSQEMGLRTAETPSVVPQPPAVGGLEAPNVVPQSFTAGVPEAPSAVPRPAMMGRPEAPSAMPRSIAIGTETEAPKAAPSPNIRQIEPSRVNYSFNVAPPDLISTMAIDDLALKFGVNRENLAAIYSAHVQDVAAYNNALVNRYSARLRAAGVPKELAQAELLRVQASELPKEGEAKRGLTEAKTAEIPLEGMSKRGLREAQAFESRQRGQAAGLLPFTSMVPTGEVDIYTGEPKMARQQSFYDIATGKTVGPGRSQQPRGDNLALIHKNLPKEKRSVIEKYFGDRTDVTAEEYLDVVNRLGK